MRRASARLPAGCPCHARAEVDRDAPVGFRSVRLRFELETDADDERVAKLVELTERYCVVLQPLARTPALSADWERVSAAPLAARTAAPERPRQ